MRTIVFDTETTGLKPGNICQLAYIICDENSDNSNSGNNGDGGDSGVIVKDATSGVSESMLRSDVGGGGADITGYNLFFKVNYIEPGAERVHGFSVDMLAELSGGRAFSELAGQVYKDFESCPLWVAHNFVFDYSFLTTEFRRCGMYLKAEQQFCTMRQNAPILKLPPKWAKSGAAPYKYPNLTELMAFYNVSEDAAIDFACDVFDADYDDLNHHDARFDCAATYLCYIRGNKQL